MNIIIWTMLVFIIISGLVMIYGLCRSAAFQEPIDEGQSFSGEYEEEQ